MDGWGGFEKKKYMFVEAESLLCLLTNCGNAMAKKHTANVNKIAGNTMWECVPSRR